MEPEVILAIQSQTYTGPWDWIITRDNPYTGKRTYANIQLAYNKMARLSRLEDYQAVWVVEADTIPPPGALDSLVSTMHLTGVDIVTGLYQLRHLSHTPNLFRYEGQTELGSPLTWELLQAWRGGPAVRVSGGCMGCVLIKTGPGLDFDFSNNEAGDGVARAPDMAWMKFCHQQGLVVAARLDVQCGHKDLDGKILNPYD